MNKDFDAAKFAAYNRGRGWPLALDDALRIWQMGDEAKQTPAAKLGEGEYVDKRTGQRFYGDPESEHYPVPDDAPPRPSCACVWDESAKQWRDLQQEARQRQAAKPQSAPEI